MFKKYGKSIAVIISLCLIFSNLKYSTISGAEILTKCKRIESNG